MLQIIQIIDKSAQHSRTHERTTPYNNFALNQNAEKLFKYQQA